MITAAIKKTIDELDQILDTDDIESQLKVLETLIATSDVCELRNPLTIANDADICDIDDAESKLGRQKSKLKPLDDFFRSKYPVPPSTELKAVDYNVLSRPDDFASSMRCMEEINKLTEQLSSDSSGLGDLAINTNKLEEQLYVSRQLIMYAMDNFVAYFQYKPNSSIITDIKNIAIEATSDIISILEDSKKIAKAEEINYEYTYTHDLLTDFVDNKLVDIQEKEIPEDQLLISIEINHGIFVENVAKKLSELDVWILDNKFIILDLEKYKIGKKGYYPKIYSNGRAKEPPDDDSDPRKKLKGYLINIKDQREVGLREFLDNSRSEFSSIANTTGLGYAINDINNIANLMVEYFSNLVNQHIKLLANINDLYKTVDEITDPEKLNVAFASISCTKDIIPISFDPEEVTLPNEGVDINHKTFDDENRPTVTELAYWKAYSKYLTLVNLLPAHWRVGLYIPTPSGIVKIKLPIIWKPLLVLDTPLGIIVLFITINGIVTSPVVWMYMYPPIGNNETRLLVTFRGSNNTIKIDTKNFINIPLSKEGFNINTDLAVLLPILEDSLPTIKRMKLSNIPWLSYLNRWHKTHKGSMGLP